MKQNNKSQFILFNINPSGGSLNQMTSAPIPPEQPKPDENPPAPVPSPSQPEIQPIMPGDDIPARFEPQMNKGSKKW